MWKHKNILFATGILVLLVLVGGIWFFFFHNSTLPSSLNISGLFGQPANNTNSSSGSTTTTVPNNQTLIENGTSAVSKIFEISNGPVTSATFIQTSNPTTTLARFMTQQDGHVFDLPINVSGAVLRPVSDITIPGTQRALWVQGGSAVVLQYLDNQTIKTVYEGFPKTVSATSSAGTSRVQFLPDNILDIAASPDGTQVAYILKNNSGGVNGYIALADGSVPKNIFSIPLTQLLITWPAPTTLLLQTKSAADTEGVIFAVGTKSGIVLPLVDGAGITAIANKDLSEIIYQTRLSGESYTHIHQLATGNDIRLPTDPIPEKCIWGSIATTMLYCANPISYVSAGYLDFWHQGTASTADNIFAFSIPAGSSVVVAAPGSTEDGGSPADIAGLAISLDNNYLLYVTKGGRSLWGVRLTQ